MNPNMKTFLEASILAIVTVGVVAIVLTILSSWRSTEFQDCKAKCAPYQCHMPGHPSECDMRFKQVE